MTITIDAPAEVEAAITQEAERAGMSVPEYTLRLFLRETSLSTAAPLRPAYDNTDAVFAQWDKEDATDDPEEYARRARKEDEFMDGLQANRFNIPQDPELVAIIESMSDRSMGGDQAA